MDGHLEKEITSPFAIQIYGGSNFMRKRQAHPFAAKAVSAALTAALLLAPAQSIAYAADAGSTQPQEQQISAFQFKYPTEHTFAEINQF